MRHQSCSRSQGREALILPLDRVSRRDLRCAKKKNLPYLLLEQNVEGGPVQPEAPPHKEFWKAQPLTPDQIAGLPDRIAKYIDVSTGCWSKELLSAPFPNGERASCQWVCNMHTFTSMKQASHHYPIDRGDGKVWRSNCQTNYSAKKQKWLCQLAESGFACFIETITNSLVTSMDR